MLDIDHFKKVNNTHLQLVRDQVLQTAAQCLAECVRPIDTLAH
ncbi:MAG: diguanylate cyclase [Candidatus Saccharibacteria bacterium]|nr:diguanylate cyclase [Rhodoferax sp.]